jgi:hypothetical protein
LASLLLFLGAIVTDVWRCATCRPFCYSEVKLDGGGGESQTHPKEKKIVEFSTNSFSGQHPKRCSMWGTGHGGSNQSTTTAVTH